MGRRRGGRGGRRGGKGGRGKPKNNGMVPNEPDVKEEAPAKNPRSCTGVLSSQPMAVDIKIDGFSLALHGRELVSDTRLDLNFGRRYGLIGLNGSGKSTMLKCIGYRELPIPKHIDSYYVDGEVAATNKTALEAVIELVESEKKRLEQEAEELAVIGDAEEVHIRLTTIYERLDELEPDLVLPRAAKILHGLGFTPDMQNQQTKDFSGGWRMRIALAKALFVSPTMLLLDEPTNHLDLEACVWLEEYLKNYNKILVLISHSQDFLNNVCTNIIHLKDKKLCYYTGNFDSFVQAREEKEVNQMKRYKWEQDQVAHIKNYIAKYGHGSAKLARQAKSREKQLHKIEAAGMTEKVVQDHVLVLRFFDVGTLPPPVLQFQDVTFGYSPDKILYKNLDFGVDLDSRVALVGPNGVGKSTLLKLMVGELSPLDGMVKRYNKLRMGVYKQHLMEQLDPEISPVQYMMGEYPEVKEVEDMRRIIGSFGLTGAAQTSPISILSDGQKCRLVLAWLAWREPHLLLLDEPTNHLDIETIDALAEAINVFDGGLVLVSHDFRLINQVAKEIWICENKAVTPYKGTIENYKDELREKVLAEIS
eukprot:CAMPEP_0174252542 /NCGR_PEP_ID=MMETSP0439-20130205/1968_1 /TAXON_ID=0 /ORGANISM="Stereomyxa ramosa, Strain Chinc5" /LENGTH=589 /DNA_ID=CAMNT_0015333095 /DNA_START=26 /DNA_END=1795 /DNA_ORIENTATION=+